MTIMRLFELQAWPQLPIRVASASRAAARASGAESTMYGSEPPSSRTTFLRCRPACSATAAPARSEPVRDTPCTRGSAMIVEIWSWVANTFWYTPSGSPASVKSSSSSCATCGLISACLSRMVLPSTRFGATKRATWYTGKFHGMIPSSGPSGSRWMNASCPENCLIRWSASSSSASSA